MGKQVSNSARTRADKVAPGSSAGLALKGFGDLAPLLFPGLLRGCADPSGLNNSRARAGDRGLGQARAIRSQTTVALPLLRPHPLPTRGQLKSAPLPPGLCPAVAQEAKSLRQREWGMGTM